jgi:hypothetical protein
MDFSAHLAGEHPARPQLAHRGGQASLDRRQYEARHRVLPKERAQVWPYRRKMLPQWNYTIKPHAHPTKGSTCL